VAHWIEFLAHGFHTTTVHVCGKFIWQSVINFGHIAQIYLLVGCKTHNLKFCGTTGVAVASVNHGRHGSVG
jgi:hypothetical protein